MKRCNRSRLKKKSKSRKIEKKLKLKKNEELLIKDIWGRVSVYQRLGPFAGGKQKLGNWNESRMITQNVNSGKYSSIAPCRWIVALFSKVHFGGKPSSLAQYMIQIGIRVIQSHCPNSLVIEKKSGTNQKGWSNL